MKKQFKYSAPDAGYFPIQTDTGEYMIYLDWSISGKLTITVWDEDSAEDTTLFDEEIDL